MNVVSITLGQIAVNWLSGILATLGPLVGVWLGYHLNAQEQKKRHFRELRARYIAEFLSAMNTTMPEISGKRATGENASQLTAKVFNASQCAALFVDVDCASQIDSFSDECVKWITTAAQTDGRGELQATLDIAKKYRELRVLLRNEVLT